MLEIPTQRKPADELLIGESWFWEPDWLEVHSITNLYEDDQDTGRVAIRDTRGDWHVLDVDQLVTVEVEERAEGPYRDWYELADLVGWLEPMEQV